jgi:CRP/FNR family cyclic AMP-dependent transcriptional regulator
MRRLPSEFSERIETLRSCRYFDGVDEEILSQLAQDVYLYRYEPDEIVFWEGGPCAGLHIVHNGSVKLFKVSPNGRRLVIKIFGLGESFNEVPVFDGGENPINVAAIPQSDIWVVACESIRRAIDEHPEMAQSIILNLSANLRMLVGLVEELSFYQVTNRLARLISGLPEEQLHGNSHQRLTQDEMAARLGSVREVVARSLRELERSGAINAKRGKIRIVDRALLTDWAQFPDE